LLKRTGLIVSLVLIAISTLAFNIGMGKAGYYYYDCGIYVRPEYPTVVDEVNVTVGVSLPCINYVVNFSTLSQSGRDFFITVDIYVPWICLPVVCDRSEAYLLGKLPADSYSVNVDLRVWDYETGLLLEQDFYSESFSVTSISVGGYSSQIRGFTEGKPLTLYLTLVAVSTIAFTMANRKTHKRRAHLPNERARKQL